MLPTGCGGPGGRVRIRLIGLPCAPLADGAGLTRPPPRARSPPESQPRQSRKRVCSGQHRVQSLRHQGGQQHARERPERALQPVSGAGRRVRGHAGLHRARQTPAEVCRGGGERCSQKLRLGARELSAWPRWREQCQRPRSIARRVCSSSQGACTHTTVCGLVSPGGQQRGSPSGESPSERAGASAGLPHETIHTNAIASAVQAWPWRSMGSSAVANFGRHTGCPEGVENVTPRLHKHASFSAVLPHLPHVI